MAWDYKETLKLNGIEVKKMTIDSVDINKLADYLWTWGDATSVNSASSQIINDIEYRTSAKTSKEFAQVLRTDGIKELDKVYSALKSAVNQRLKEGYNNCKKQILSTAKYYDR